MNPLFVRKLSLTPSQDFNKSLTTIHFKNEHTEHLLLVNHTWLRETRIWNALPNKIHLLTTLRTFKTILTDYYYSAVHST